MGGGAQVLTYFQMYFQTLPMHVHCVCVCVCVCVTCSNAVPERWSSFMNLDSTSLILDEVVFNPFT